jgi:diguanylate cyclase (GGDEF)-like protein
MNERRHIRRARTLRSGKILLNNKSSVIDCTVRNLSADGACLRVASVAGIPPSFDLLIDGETASLACDVIWQSPDQVGVSFHRLQSEPRTAEDHEQNGKHMTMPSSDRRSHEQHAAGDLVRGELLALRAALDDVPIGVALLDQELRARFLNRAFRKMWRLSDAKAESKPPFIALMYHGRDTRAYDVAPGDIDAYVAQRVAHVKAGDPRPLDLRLASGEVIRFQCAVLPAGGRMLSYTYVTDIVSHSDELEILRSALDNVEPGVVLLDPAFNAQFMNRAVRRLWKVSDEEADRKPAYAELVNEARVTRVYDMPPDELDHFIASRIARARAGDPTPQDVRVSDGRIIRSQCAVLPSGGRMLTYTDVTDLVRYVDELERLATTDCLTGLHNRRHFLALAEAEWSRFQRYHRPLALIVFDVDLFKSINDGFGHAVGDRALTHLADLCNESKRSSDIVGRIGGDEFAILLPETELKQADLVAGRLRQALAGNPLITDDGSVPITISMGLVEATLSMSSIDALMKMADEALYKAKRGGRNCAMRSLPNLSVPHKIAAE